MRAAAERALDVTRATVAAIAPTATIRTAISVKATPDEFPPDGAAAPEPPLDEPADEAASSTTAPIPSTARTATTMAAVTPCWSRRCGPGKLLGS